MQIYDINWVPGVNSANRLKKKDIDGHYSLFHSYCRKIEEQKQNQINLNPFRLWHNQTNNKQIKQKSIGHFHILQKNHHSIDDDDNRQ